MHVARAIGPTVLAVLLLTATTFALRAENAKPAVWAMYYAWYETPTATHAKWRFWSDDPATNSAPRLKSKAQPLISCYDSDNPGVVRWHIQLAKAAGINAFLVSWWGGANLSGAAFEKTILPIAAEECYKVALCSELAQFHRDLSAMIRQTADVLRRTIDSSAYLRLEGKPVVYLYQVPFNPKLTPQTFKELTQGVEREVGPVYWVMDKVSNPQDQGLSFPREWLTLPEISMLGFYGTFSIKRVWRNADLAPDYLALASQAHAAGKKIFLPAHPGHDNSGFRPDDFFIIPREDGETLRGYLRAGTSAGADVLLLTSFNEWPETTVVEPSSSWPDPYLYLKIIAHWNGRTFQAPPLPVARGQTK